MKQRTVYRDDSTGPKDDMGVEKQCRRRKRNRETRNMLGLNREMVKQVPIRLPIATPSRRLRSGREQESGRGYAPAGRSKYRKPDALVRIVPTAASSRPTRRLNAPAVLSKVSGATVTSRHNLPPVAAVPDRLKSALPGDPPENRRNQERSNADVRPRLLNAP